MSQIVGSRTVVSRSSDKNQTSFGFKAHVQLYGNLGTFKRINDSDVAEPDSYNLVLFRIHILHEPGSWRRLIMSEAEVNCTSVKSAVS